MRLNGSGSIVKITREHYPTLRRWYKARGKVAPKWDSLSTMGYMVDGRVAGFLYLTNSNMAMIEGIISNPDTVPSLRKTSLYTLCGLLVDKALLLGYVNIFGISRHPSIGKICKNLGFKESTFNVYTLSEKPID